MDLPSVRSSSISVFLIGAALAARSPGSFPPSKNVVFAGCELAKQMILDDPASTGTKFGPVA
jgi:hypothetical protein